ncbi:glycosyl transferase family A [Nocardioides flavus (ex Wang et al. 2016)]|uniref:Glycosyl transferase family A n=1 Tax=Nocardioides flavus (ex Wang et al. 2016) TaxID=2058780 RepID=A0ABQ3HGK0_9ACTN|nr:glycosyltransferase family 2 protein [Nocardioides flavus (ex Wang et al. 2016)]GHE16676.1 glycosyl transferase family A [Nocardioides flavus (ex Wang et al. 2016)]
MSGAPPHVAVVTIAHGRHDHLAGQHRSLARGSALPDTYLVVAMDDPGIVEEHVGALAREVVHLPRARGGALPLASARNLGVRTALDRGADVVVLLDVDCLAGERLVAAYAEVVTARPGWIWSGPVTYLPPPPAEGYPEDPADLAAWDDPHPARPRPEPGELVHAGDPDLFWSLSFAVDAPTWRHLGGFCEDYVGYGGEDTDLGRTAVALGIGLGWVGGARAFHQHHPVSSPPVEHLDDILRNGRVFHERWGEWPMTGWLEEFERRGLVRRLNGHWVRESTTDDPKESIA